MSTLGDLYRQAQNLQQQRQAEAMQQQQPNPKLVQEIDELQRIKTGLLQAYKDADGSKAV